jgi:hypothetical protein
VTDIPSVPDLEWHFRECLAAAFRLGPFEGSWGRGWYTAYRELEHAENALDTARWRQACESHQWVTQTDLLRSGHDEDYWWRVLKGTCRLRWLRRNDELLDYLPPSREIVVRPKAEVVA